MSTPRGLRNCNPLNIRLSGDKWKGMKAQQQDGDFCQFESMEWGWRAAFRLLTRTYYHKYRLYNIRDIIHKWAPVAENNTRAYIDHVAQLSGIGALECLGNPSEQPLRWITVAAAMAIHENGTTDINPIPMLQGWNLSQNNT